MVGKNPRSPTPGRRGGVLLAGALLLLPLALNGAPAAVTASSGPEASEEPILFQDDFSEDPEASGLWSVYRRTGDADNEASWNEAEQSLHLTRATSQKAAAVFADFELATRHWEAAFTYRAGGGSGADGFVFFFYKDQDAYRVDRPVDGGSMGFHVDGDAEFYRPVSGLGVEFDNYHNALWEDPSSNHIALVQDTVSNHLVAVNDGRTEDNRDHDVLVRFDDGRVRVTVDGEEMLDHVVAAVDYANTGVGFSSATGDRANDHVIRDLTIRPGQREAPTLCLDPAQERFRLTWSVLPSPGCPAGSLPPDGGPADYAWQLWEVDNEGRGTHLAGAEGHGLAHTFQETGRYRIQLDATDPLESFEPVAVRGDFRVTWSSVLEADQPAAQLRWIAPPLILHGSESYFPTTFPSVASLAASAHEDYDAGYPLAGEPARMDAGHPVYVRVVEYDRDDPAQAESPTFGATAATDFAVVQYWFYYAFNPGTIRDVPWGIGFLQPPEGRHGDAAGVNCRTETTAHEHDFERAFLWLRKVDGANDYEVFRSTASSHLGTHYREEVEDRGAALYVERGGHAMSFENFADVSCHVPEDHRVVASLADPVRLTGVAALGDDIVDGDGNLVHGYDDRFGPCGTDAFGLVQDDTPACYYQRSDEDKPGPFNGIPPPWHRDEYEDPDQLWSLPARARGVLLR